MSQSHDPAEAAHADSWRWQDDEVMRLQSFTHADIQRVLDPLGWHLIDFGPVQSATPGICNVIYMLDVCAASALKTFDQQQCQEQELHEQQEEQQELVLKLSNPNPAFRRIRTEHEVATMQFVAAHTNIPVARVLAYCSDASRSCLGCEYLLMERLPGVPMSDVTAHGRGLPPWLYEQFASDYVSVLQQLHGVADRMPLPFHAGLQFSYACSLDAAADGDRCSAAATRAPTVESAAAAAAAATAPTATASGIPSQHALGADPLTAERSPPAVTWGPILGNFPPMGPFPLYTDWVLALLFWAHCCLAVHMDASSTLPAAAAPLPWSALAPDVAAAARAFAAHSVARDALPASVRAALATALGEFAARVVLPLRSYEQSLPPAHPWRRIRFCHADLNPGNVLLDPRSGRITGILDWEHAGATLPDDDWTLACSLLGSGAGARAMDASTALAGGGLAEPDGYAERAPVRQVLYAAAGVCFASSTWFRQRGRSGVERRAAMRARVGRGAQHLARQLLQAGVAVAWDGARPAGGDADVNCEPGASPHASDVP